MKCNCGKKIPKTRMICNKCYKEHKKKWSSGYYLPLGFASKINLRIASEVK